MLVPALTVVQETAPLTVMAEGGVTVWLKVGVLEPNVWLPLTEIGTEIFAMITFAAGLAAKRSLLVATLNVLAAYVAAPGFVMPLMRSDAAVFAGRQLLPLHRSVLSTLEPAGCAIM